MSTRCNVLVKDKYSEQWFYRHSDGYPSVTAVSLQKFVNWLDKGIIRDNVSQGSSWLIIMGNTEYSKDESRCTPEPSEEDECYGWKVGAYEITSCKHGDIEYLYTIDMHAKTVTVDETTYSYKDFTAHDFSE